MTHLRYRADIDGLRALAVLAVVIYHAFPKYLPGGFVGVDIFFVISGYLISGILYKGINRGDFSFTEFYARRVRRIFPALLTMLLLVMAYGWVALLPDEFQQLSKHVAAGALFMQNIVFWQESGYFDAAANLKPLLHLWSLAVEEQFYIFFPPVLLLILKRKWPLLGALLLLVVSSMIGNIVMSSHDQKGDFFLAPFRAWEFLGGSLLAWWHYGRGHEEDIPRFRELLSTAGGFLIAFSIVFIDQDVSFPGCFALLPVTGTLLIIEGGKDTWVNRKIFSNPAAIWIGLISYPLYLLHWPVLSFLHIVKGENPRSSYIFAALGISLFLSTITYYLIEKPIRYSKSRWTTPILLGVFIIVGFIGFYFLKFKPHSAISIQVDKVINAKKDIDAFRDWSQQNRVGDVLIYSAGGSGNQTLILGDSNAWMYAPRFLRLLKESNNKEQGVIIIGAGGVPPISDLENQNYPKSKDLMRVFEELLESNTRIKTVVIAARWDLYFSQIKKLPFQSKGNYLYKAMGRNSAIEQLGNDIKNLKSKGKKVILVLSVPNGPEFHLNKVFIRSFTGVVYNGYENVAKAQYLGKLNREDTRNSLRQVGLANGAVVVDPMDYLSKGDFLILQNEDGPIRFDEGHLRPGYVRERVKYLDDVLSP